MDLWWKGSAIYYTSAARSSWTRETGRFNMSWEDFGIHWQTMNEAKPKAVTPKRKLTCIQLKLTGTPNQCLKFRRRDIIIINDLNLVSILLPLSISLVRLSGSASAISWMAILWLCSVNNYHPVIDDLQAPAIKFTRLHSCWISLILLVDQSNGDVVLKFGKKNKTNVFTEHTLPYICLNPALH